MMHIDLIDQATWEREVPYETLAVLRRNDPVHWHEEPDGPGFWAITRHDDIKQISNDPQRFSSHAAGVSRLDIEDPVALEAYRSILIAMDPPEHRDFRGLISTVFTPRAIAELEGVIRRLARSAIEKIVEKKQIDFVADYAAVVPMNTINEMMGVPEDIGTRLMKLSGGLIDDQDPEVAPTADFRENASAETYLIAQQLAASQSGAQTENLTKRLLEAELEGRRLTDNEFNLFFLFLIVAGNETTRTAASGGLITLLDHPDQLVAIREDLSLLPDAVEEMLRYWPPIHHFRRTAMCDVKIRDKVIQEGQKVLMWYPAANRDDLVFDDPDRFDIRRHPNEHLSFGFGEHFCLGASLARLELRVMFEELLTATKTISTQAPPRRLRSNLINGIKEMRLEITPS